MFAGLRNVTPADLKVGSIYFMVSYFDDAMLVPELATLVYLGKEVDGTKDGLWYFQDADSYFASGPYPTGGKDGNLCAVPDDGLKSICELDQVIVSLQECARRRKNKGV